MAVASSSRQGIPSVAGKFPCPILGCTFSESGGPDCRFEPFQTADLAFCHLKDHHKQDSKRFVGKSVEKHQEDERKRKEQKLEQTRRRVKACRQRNKENEAPTVHGICTVFASLFGTITPADTIDKLKEIVNNLKKTGDVPLKADCNLNHVDCQGCRLALAIVGFQAQAEAAQGLPPSQHALACIHCKGPDAKLVPLLGPTRTGKLMNYIKRECPGDADLRPMTVYELDQMEPTVVCKPAIVQDMPDGVLLGDFLQSLHPRPLSKDAYTLTEQEFLDGVLDGFAKGRYVRFGFAPKEGTNQALVQLRNSLLDDFERGTMGYTDRVLTSLVLVYSPVTHRNKELGSAMHMDVSDFSTLAVGLQHFKGVKGWADSTAMQQGATVADWHLIKPSHASKAARLMKEMGLALPDFKRPLNDRELQQLRDAGIEVLHLPQRHGDLVEVPPGWLHQVTNRLPNVKVSWDRRVIAHLRAYPCVHAFISAHMGALTLGDSVGIARCCTNNVLGECE